MHTDDTHLQFSKDEKDSRILERVFLLCFPAAFLLWRGLIRLYIRGGGGKETGENFQSAAIDRPFAG